MPVTPMRPAHEGYSSGASTPTNISAQQQTLMDESGKMLEYMRKEVFKLRQQNTQLRADYNVMKDTNTRLHEVNASAGASFAALNQHYKQMAKHNAKLTQAVQDSKKNAAALQINNHELKEELRMKQDTYITEVTTRLNYQRVMGRMVDFICQESSDEYVVDEIMALQEECDLHHQGTEPKGMMGEGKAEIKKILRRFSTPNKNFPSPGQNFVTPGKAHRPPGQQGVGHMPVPMQRGPRDPMNTPTIASKLKSFFYTG
uniref:Uncharacterized protein n=1 Tax=Corethron hystrix TaxID=216773 RepID=A0A6U5LFN6_9STRA